MKTRLNLTIDEATLEAIKEYAARKETSVSEMVEAYFRKITHATPRRKSILSLVDKLNKPTIDPKADLKDLYYQEQAKHHGA